MNRRYAFHLLLTPGFLLALTSLLLNDQILKLTVGGPVTGKLSDVAGLFAFTLAALSLLPRRQIVVALGIALLFTFWKLPLSAPMIDAWNDVGLFRIGRVVDLTDLLALLSIPLALLYATRNMLPPVRRSPTLVPIIVIIAAFAFTATSCIQGYHYEKANYGLEGTSADVDSALASMVRDSLLVDYLQYPNQKVVMLTIEDPRLEAYPITISAEITMTERSAGSVMALQFIRDPYRACGPFVGCGSSGGHEKRKGLMRQAFERRVVEGVRRRVARTGEE